jgi:hypothetical protein
MRKNGPRFNGYGRTSCSLVAFLAELFQLFARKDLFKGEHCMKTTLTETQALVQQDSEPNRPAETTGASHSPEPETSMQETISKLAYGLWEERGSSQGSADEDWLEAERNFRESTERVYP